MVPLHDRLPPPERPAAGEQLPLGEPELPRARTRSPSAPEYDDDDELDYERAEEGFGPAAVEGLPARLAPIVEAAERAAEAVRARAEQRARERISEADRAVENRIRAAETEVNEILAGAQAEAERLRLAAVDTVGRIHGEAEERRREAEAVLDRARQDADAVLAHARQQGEALVDQAREKGREVVAEAQEEGERVRARATDEARGIIGTAHAAAREVAGEGGEVTQNLRELSVSLRANAERLLRDIRMVHSSMVAQLERATPQERPRASETGASAGPGGRTGGRAKADSAAAGAGGRVQGEREAGGSSGSERRSLLRRGRGGSAAPADPPAGDFDVPEFLPRQR